MRIGTGTRTRFWLAWSNYCIGPILSPATALWHSGRSLESQFGKRLKAGGWIGDRVTVEVVAAERRA